MPVCECLQGGGDVGGTLDRERWRHDGMMCRHREFSLAAVESAGLGGEFGGCINNMRAEKDSPVQESPLNVPLE